MNDLLDNVFVSYFLVFMVALALGSFFNVIIYRLPIILNEQWNLFAHHQLNLVDSKDAMTKEKDRLGLSFPLSHCPQCKTPLLWYHNIPLLSYLIQKGKCSFCCKKISYQYPLVEILTAFTFCALYYRFGWNITFFFSTVLTSFLIIITFIDMKHQIIPDILSLPLVWMGLLVNSENWFLVSLQSAVWGAVIAYLIFWFIFQLFKLVTGKEGMGYGDFKLFAALGAWLGLISLPYIVIVASCVGLFYAFISKVTKNQVFAFGPFLAVAGWLVLFFYTDILKMYGF